MYTKRNGVVVFILLVFSTVFISLSAQQANPDFLKNYQWLDDKDLKDWEKQLDLISQADELIQQSNSKYIEVYNLENNSEGKGNKSKIEEEAFELAVESLQTYKSAYETMHKISMSYLTGAKKNHSAYSEATYYKSEADKLYQNAGKVKTLDEQKLLADANENLLLAIEKNIIAITISPNAYRSPEENVVNPVATSEDVVINDDVYQKYLAYINNDLIADPITMQQLSAMQGEDMSYDAFQKLWEKYNSGSDMSLETGSVDLADKMDQDSLAPSENLSESTNIDIQEPEIIIENEQVQPDKKQEAVSSDVSALNTASVSSNGYSMHESLEFRVQVAASKSQLSLTQLMAIYSGGLQLVEVKEGDYYKYQVRSFKELSEAQKAVSNSGVANAFIHAYKGADRLYLAEAVKESRRNGVSTSGDQIDFAVQLAASRTRLKSTQLDMIYSGNYPVSIILEEGWYKYQVIIGNNLELANEVLSNCGVNKSFIAAYKNGIKQELYKAVDTYKKTKQ